MLYNQKPQSVSILFLFAFSLFLSNSILAQEIEVDPQELNFGECVIGAVNEMNFTIWNVGEDPLRIDSLVSSDHFEVWIKEYADARRTLLDIYSAVLQYGWEKGEDPTSVEELIEENYFSLSEDMAEQWSFTLIGANPVSQIETVSTADMPYGAGYVVLWDTERRFFDGYSKPGDLSLSSNEGSNCTVIFNPEETVDYDETITIESNDPDNGEVAVSLTGTGIHEEVIEVELWSRNFGMVKVGEAKVAQMTIRNSGGRNVMVDEIEFDDDHFSVLFPEAAQAWLAIIDIFEALEMYNQDYGEDPASVAELIELYYLVLDEDVARKWNFDFVGLNPVTQIEAVSTRQLKRGGGHVIVWDPISGFSGFGRCFRRYENPGLGVGNECEVSLWFLPTEIRRYNCTMTIRSDDPINPEIEIELHGNGVLDVQSETAPAPTEYGLLPAYPNPFNSTTTIRYNLPFPTHVSLQVYNLSGQQITTLFEGYRQAGFHSANLTASDLPSGLYFVQLKASDQVFTQKVMLIR